MVTTCICVHGNTGAGGLGLSAVTSRSWGPSQLQESPRHLTVPWLRKVTAMR